MAVLEGRLGWQCVRLIEVLLFAMRWCSVCFVRPQLLRGLPGRFPLSVLSCKKARDESDDQVDGVDTRYKVMIEPCGQS